MSDASSFSFTPAAAKPPSPSPSPDADGEVLYDEYDAEAYVEGEFDDAAYEDQYGEEVYGEQGEWQDGYLDENGIAYEGSDFDENSSYSGSYQSTPHMGAAFYGGGTRSAGASPFAPPAFLGATYDMPDFNGYYGKRKKAPITLDNQTRLNMEQDLASAQKEKKATNQKTYGMDFLLAFKDRPEMKNKTEELMALNLNIIKGHEEDGEALTTSAPVKAPTSSKKKNPTPVAEKHKKKGPGGGVGGSPIGPRTSHPNSVFKDHSEGNSRSVGNSPAGPRGNFKRTNSRDNGRSLSRSNSRDFDVYTGPVEPLKMSENRWQKPDGQSDTEEAAAQKKILALLNKLTPEKWDKLIPQFLEVKITRVDTMRAIVERIFSKAVLEKVFAEMYANLCVQLASSLPDAQQEGEKKPTSFKMLLLQRCSEALQQLAEEEEEEEEEEGAEEVDSSADKEERLQNAHRQMLGTMTVFAELYRKGLVAETMMLGTMEMLISVEEEEEEEEEEDEENGPELPDERDIEAFCVLVTTMGQTMEENSIKGKEELEEHFETIKVLSTDERLPPRMRFMLKDLLDLRKNRWVLRQKKVVDPKSLDAIKQEANSNDRKMQKSHSAWPGGAGSSRQMRRTSSGGASGGGSPFFTPGASPNTTPKQSPAFGASFRGDDSGGKRRGKSPPRSAGGANALKRSQSEGAHFKKTGNDYTTPGGKPPRPPGAHTPSASPPIEQQSKVDKKAMKKKAEGIINEYLSIREVEESMEGLKEMGDSSFHGAFVALALETSLEKGKDAQGYIGDMLSELSKKYPETLTSPQLEKGFVRMFGMMDDLIMDYPKAPEILGTLLGRCVAVKGLELALVHPLNQTGGDDFQRFLASRNGSSFVVASLNALKEREMAESEIKEMWIGTGLQPSDWMPADDANAEGVENCLTKAGLAFLVT